MKRKTILILGDSTSMTIGERKMYPFQLADLNGWAKDARILNCSIPGFTSADACAFFFRNKKCFGQLSAVIIYLGNCDAISSELRKGKYTPLRQCMDGMKGKSKSKTKLKNRLLHFEWNDNFDSTIESSESPENFKYNISRVVSVCQRMGVVVILIQPQANALFPAGVGKGNFVFYKYLGLNDRIAERISIEDPRFKSALTLHEHGKFAEAMGAYKNILLESGPLSANLEYQSLVVNNYAVCAAQAGSIPEAEHLLNQLMKERGVRKEIILYNLAQIAKLKGDMNRYRHLLVESYESDESMYRIREPYKLAIDQVSKMFKNVSVIDLKDFIGLDDYVDHCHPLSQAQALIAQHVTEKIHVPELKGESLLTIENRLYNPEYALGNLAEFHSYFKSFAPFTADQIKSFILEFMNAGNESSAMNKKIPTAICKAIEYWLEHPCFSRIKDIVFANPSYPADVGRFPEYFVFRYLIPYTRTVEEHPQLSRLFSPEIGLLKSSKELIALLPSSEGVKEEVLDFEQEYQREYLQVILKKIYVMLNEHLGKGNQVYNRLKTTIFWYFRETLRFGSHSRISMRYERIPLEFIAEGLAVAAVINFKINGNLQTQIQSIIRFLEEIVKTHEHYCRKFSLQSDSQEMLKEYDEKLMSHAKEIKRIFSSQLDREEECIKCTS